MSAVVLRLLLFTCETVDLYRHYKGVGIDLHPCETLVIVGTKTDQCVRKISKIVILPDFLRLILIVQMSDEPVLDVLQDI
jgi:hypothetical protein